MSKIAVKPIPLKDRSPYIFIEYGLLDIEDGAFVVKDKNGIRTKIPIGLLACIMLGPGTTITHEAIKLAADVRCLILWSGENGIRHYSAGMPGGTRCDRLLIQASAALDPNKRSIVVRRMYQHRFDEPIEGNLSIEQWRGKEAYRVKSIYSELSKQYGIEWKGRRYDASNWNSGDPINRCISAATSCLYGLTEASILIAGYSPAIGFIHTGRQRSFVYDVADLVKYDKVVPLAFRIASENPPDLERTVRYECRELFGKTKLLEKLIPLINGLFEGIETVLPEGVVLPPDFSDSEGRYYDGTDS